MRQTDDTMPKTDKQSFAVAMPTAETLMRGCIESLYPETGRPAKWIVPAIARRPFSALPR